jgi:hypothetical protein
MQDINQVSLKMMVRYKKLKFFDAQWWQDYQGNDTLSWTTMPQWDNIYYQGIKISRLPLTSLLMKKDASSFTGNVTPDIMQLDIKMTRYHQARKHTIME